MSYAIIRNEKHTKGDTTQSNNHNERRYKNYSNKNIDPSRTHLNFHLKKPELTYVKEFQKIKETYNLKGQIKTTSNITCEYMVTSDKKFFDNLGYEETKRYFQESYNFLSNYKNLKEQYIISAVVHMDEDTPHMHITYVPVISTVDKLGNPIEKLSCRDFWHGKNSYGELQDNFYEHVTSKGFKLERGQPKEITGREYLSPEQYKKATNYYETKKMLSNIKLELPDVPDITDIKKIMLGRDEKIVNEIIKPKDKLIKELYSDNVTLHTELTKQAKVIDKATEFEIKYDSIIAYNSELENRCTSVEKEYIKKSNELDIKFDNKVQELEKSFEVKTTEFKRELRKDYYELEKENKYLKRIVSTVKSTIDKFIKWVCKKFDVSVDDVARDFQKENRVSLDPVVQMKKEDREKEWEIEK